MSCLLAICLCDLQHKQLAEVKEKEQSLDGMAARIRQVKSIFLYGMLYHTNYASLGMDS